jgi:hypothetical protein
MTAPMMPTAMNAPRSTKRTAGSFGGLAGQLLSRIGTAGTAGAVGADAGGDLLNGTPWVSGADGPMGEDAYVNIGANRRPIDPNKYFPKPDTIKYTGPRMNQGGGMGEEGLDVSTFRSAAPRGRPSNPNGGAGGPAAGLFGRLMGLMGGRGGFSEGAVSGAGSLEEQKRKAMERAMQMGGMR